VTNIGLAKHTNWTLSIAIAGTYSADHARTLLAEAVVGTIRVGAASRGDARPCATRTIVCPHAELGRPAVVVADTQPSINFDRGMVERASAAEQDS
jgi:hypothetical protein